MKTGEAYYWSFGLQNGLGLWRQPEDCAYSNLFLKDCFGGKAN